MMKSLSVELMKTADWNTWWSDAGQGFRAHIPEKYRAPTIL